MTDKEFRKLSKSELIDIIYEYQKQEKLLRTENEMLNEKLKNKNLKLSQSGNIAEAFLNLSGIFENAQETADQYVSYIKSKADEEAKEIIEQAKKEALSYGKKS